MVLVFGFGFIRRGHPVCCCVLCAQAVGVKAWSSGCLCPGLMLRGCLGCSLGWVGLDVCARVGSS